MSKASKSLVQDDHDLEKIINVLDEAIMSDDPRIQECLRRLMVTVALIESTDSIKTGPLRQLFNEVDRLSGRISQLEHAFQYNNTRAPVQSYPGSQPFLGPPWTTTYGAVSSIDAETAKWLIK